MFEIQVEATFSAAHRLEGYNGKCKNLHGHNWSIINVWRGDDQDDIGMVIDFKELKTLLNNAIQPFDHGSINRIISKPTAENIAKHIFNALTNSMTIDMRKSKIHLDRVIVEETQGCLVTYYPNEQRIN